MRNPDGESRSERRPYYKEPNTKYGRPRVRIKKTPPAGFSLAQHDETARQLGLRGYLDEIVQGDIRHEFKQEHPGFHKRGIAPGLETADEINRFLVRPDPVTIVKDEKTARHVLLLNMVLIAVDPNVPDLAARLRNVGKEIENSTRFLLPGRQVGLPSPETSTACSKRKCPRGEITECWR